MAQSSCPKCGGHSFELVNHTPKGCNVNLCFIQCSQCGCVVGTLESQSAAILVKKLAAKLDIKID